MSTLATKTGLLLIEGITISFENYFSADDRPEFIKSRKNLIDALRTFEKTSELGSRQETIEAHDQVELCLNALLDFFDNETPSKKIFDLIFCDLYKQVMKTFHDFEDLLNIHAQKQYLLADLFEIPMDDIHGHLLEYGVPLESHYSKRVLDALLTRTRPSEYSEQALENMQDDFRLTTAQTTERLERLHSYFERTAARYEFTAHSLILQLLEKKRRNATVHVGRSLIAHYRKHKELFGQCNRLVSNNFRMRVPAENEFDCLLGEDGRKSIQRDLRNSTRQESERKCATYKGVQPKLIDFLNRPQLKPMQTLFTNEEINQLEKMFTHYCKSYIEKW